MPANEFWPGMEWRKKGGWWGCLAASWQHVAAARTRLHCRFRLGWQSFRFMADCLERQRLFIANNMLLLLLMMVWLLLLLLVLLPYLHAESAIQFLHVCCCRRRTQVSTSHKSNNRETCLATLANLHVSHSKSWTLSPQSPVPSRSLSPPVPSHYLSIRPILDIPNAINVRRSTIQDRVPTRCCFIDLNAAHLSWFLIPDSWFEDRTASTRLRLSRLSTCHNCPDSAAPISLGLLTNYKLFRLPTHATTWKNRRKKKKNKNPRLAR